MDWLAKVIKEILTALGWYTAGTERQRRKQEEAAREIERQQREIAARPNLTRDELNRRMLDRAARNGSVPKVPGPER